ncbi:MAG: hypothetical protein JW715_06280 [Sedimentisphaerales bacterium]|nr:hypothetical protein [Sedimentisphaerales bacterium]
MKKWIIYIAILFAASTPCSNATESNLERSELTELMKESIVYLEISKHGYNQGEPWKHSDVTQEWACACAVGEYQVVTTAESVANHTYLKALRYGQNEFIGAQLEVVDYEANLCLIRLDPNALSKPLRPLTFSEDYLKGAEVNCYWLSSENRIYNGRGYLDRVNVQKTRTSHAQYLQYIVADTTQRTSFGEIYCVGSSPVGIACWSNNDKETGLIPAEIINHFLNSVKDGNYTGLGKVGFAVSELLNPAMRSFLKMPESLKSGVYVTDVYNLGTGHNILKKDDVILAIDGNTLDPYGRFMHPKYELLLFDHLITSKSVGENIIFEIWRDGKKTEIQGEVKTFKPSEMLVPYHEFDQQPEYIVTAGFTMQKLTREYLMEFGRDMSGDTPSHLYHYYRDLAFKPTDERRDIVVLSYVLPTPFNLGYAGLGQMVVSKYNGMKISSIEDILVARNLNPESKYDVIEFELDSPVVVIDRRQTRDSDVFVQKNYGITNLLNINQQKPGI